ncbi:MAG: ABC transporter ATP-binding protein [Candidatus Paceibacterota bacterium]
MSLFEVINLKKTYYGDEIETHVLKGLNFSIKKGEFVSIMGPSGSGKSTLLHILGFLDNHTSGEYLFNEKKYSDYTENETADIRNQEMGFVFQQFNLLQQESVYSNILLPLIYSSIPEKEWDSRIREVIDLVGLTHRTNYRTSKLSGGEKQRVAIARALINKPNVIFADEPTGNLDSKSGQVIMETLQRLHDEFGHTIILITHETYTAEHADRIIRIKDGLVESDTKVKEKRRSEIAFIK